jgi:hypothetical protein
MTKMDGLECEVTDLYGKRKIIVQSIDNLLYELYMSLMDCCEGAAVVEAADRVFCLVFSIELTQIRWYYSQ